MTDTDQNGAAAAEAAATQSPKLNILAQYIKDLSFENPNAPESLRPRQTQPQINVQVNVNGKPMSDTDFEVDLKLDARAEVEDTLMFNIELLYSGVFRITDVPKESIHPIVMIECPRLLFPFARQILADSSQRGGFPPLFIDPFDFADLYRQKAAELATQQPNPATTPS